MNYLLAIDQGTTSTRAIIFNQHSQLVAQHQIPLQQYFPHPGWVEHDANEIWESVITCCHHAINKAALNAAAISGIGISNQRETTIIWDRETGEPVHRALVWQGRRTTDYCMQLSKRRWLARKIRAKTGLLIDPYFSATKIRWLLDNVAGLRQRAERGVVLFGTVDCFLLWKLTGGKVHATDISNASRTLLYNIYEQDWDTSLLKIFNIPRKILPKVYDNNAHFGDTDRGLFDSVIPITGMAGDQQAATIGQACFHKGMVKSTYGTGCFVMANTGKHALRSKNRLLTTIIYRINKQVTYGLEGSIFVAGAAVQWLRDALHLIHNATETQNIAMETTTTDGVYLVPAFTGLGAPYWDPRARGALVGLNRDSGVKQIVRAALEAVCYQTRDLLGAMQDDGIDVSTLRVDGGMAKNDWLLQFLSDILDVEVARPFCTETSALGAAYVAGLGAGIYHSLDDISQQWQSECSFKPHMLEAERERLYQGWQKAVAQVMAMD